MGARRPRSAHKEAIDDADHSLRAASRRFPEALTRFVVSDGEKVEHTEWTETQVAARQRRLDRTLLVRLATGESRLVHVEWTDRLNRRVRERVAEYHWNLSEVSFHDARVRRRRGDKNAKPVAIESVVVVLGGRKKPWPEFGVVRSSPRHKRFCGVKFRIEPVYQSTVAELEAKGNVFWLVFVPLARDVDEEKLRHIVKELRDKVDKYEFAELAATMLSMAKLKKDVPGLVDVVRSLLKEEAPVRSFEFIWPEKLDRIKEEVRVESREEGRKEGREEGREEGLAPLVYLFERRLRRTLTAGERRRLSSRIEKDGPEKVGAVVLDFSRDKLAQWLAPRKSAAKRRSIRRKPSASV